MKNKPLVSVILPSYNHGKYIGEAIESVLKQDFEDFEFLISDDASSDNTVEIIKKYNDPRIKAHFFKSNQGATINGGYLLNQVKGKYVALINSDDVWLPNKLSTQVEFMESQPEYGACFTWAKLIDENGEDIKAKDLVFNQPNRTQGGWLEYFFTKGNCLCHPSMLIKSEAYEVAGSYNLAMRQLPDFDMWVRLVKKYPIHIITSVYVAHRRFIHSGENTSSPILSNSLRDINESSFVLSSFFDDVNDKILVEGFKKHFRKSGILSHEDLICEKFFLLIDGKYYMGIIPILTAITYFFKIYNNPNVVETFRNHYGFTMQDFHQITGSLDLVGMLPKEISAGSALEFDIDRYVKENKAKVLSLLLFNKESKSYRFFKKVYFKVRGKQINY